MSDTLRGAVLLVSVLLWLPFLRPLLGGDLTVAEGLVRYAGTLLLSWAGVAGLATLVAGYVRAGEAADVDTLRRHADDAPRPRADEAPRRRADDLSA